MEYTPQQQFDLQFKYNCLDIYDNIKEIDWNSSYLYGNRATEKYLNDPEFLKEFICFISIPLFCRWYGKIHTNKKIAVLSEAAIDILAPWMTSKYWKELLEPRNHDDKILYSSLVVNLNVVDKYIEAGAFGAALFIKKYRTVLPEWFIKKHAIELTEEELIKIIEDIKYRAFNIEAIYIENSIPYYFYYGQKLINDHNSENCCFIVKPPSDMSAYDMSMHVNYLLSKEHLKVGI
jgi:hypothetical protein